MKLRLTEQCGIVHEVEAELLGVAPTGEMCFLGHVDIEGPALMEVEPPPAPGQDR